jgi:ubiquinone/menaquinone biosynthesis C-methylase UbiE
MSDSPSGSPTRAWSRPSAAAPDGRSLPTDVATYGPGLPTETELRLLGTLEGKRVLDLGCGAGHAAVAFARAGAKVIAVDPSAEQLDATREAAEAAGVRVELQHAGLAELAFVRGDGIDLVWSSYALAEVTDLDRVFRQVHRVLRAEAPIVFTLPHPAFTMFVAGPGRLDPPTGSPPAPQRSYHEAATYTVDRGGDRVTDTPRTISSIFTSLARANFRVDHLLEPRADRAACPPEAWTEAMAWVPPALIVRARKQGI